MTRARDTLFGRYRIVRRLPDGRGEVYHPHHLDLDRPAALKLFGRSDSHVERLGREGAVLARLRATAHRDAVIEVYDPTTGPRTSPWSGCPAATPRRGPAPSGRTWTARGRRPPASRPTPAAA